LAVCFRRLVRQGGPRGLASGREGHEVWQGGLTKVAIPRHREIDEITAQGIFTTLEAEFGLGWWKG